MSIVLEVFFPESNTTNTEHPASMDLWDALALSFFLEALYKGSSLFNARPFKMVTTDTDRVPAKVGEGVYEVVDRDLQVIEETGEITGIIIGAWIEMKIRIGRK
ncbi:hypothetical protein KSC_026690 [Ktedonobacter sp. SOSP1-52]|uniref:hypothetical protein n=1 Tax=Ktedonobacter sp. SOSP1-52 TaxID=2778366 RepID=UPI001916572C|nr:hypothetical protein [Ktedonobacter sp. SOSP1-52]GHO63777.1 hypothetical protein KSC_026690 [Ktedonobacter sp. SOSP1-52]